MCDACIDTLLEELGEEEAESERLREELDRARAAAEEYGTAMRELEGEVSVLQLELESAEEAVEELTQKWASLTTQRVRAEDAEFELANLRACYAGLSLSFGVVAERAEKAELRLARAKQVMLEHHRGLTFDGRWPERLVECHCLACDVYRALTAEP